MDQNCPPHWFDDADSSLLLLTKVLYPSSFQINTAAKDKIKLALKKLGAVSRDEKKVFIIFLMAACLWIGRPYLKYHEILLGLTDTVIAILAAILLFILPSDNKKSNLLEWDETKKITLGIITIIWWRSLFSKCNQLIRVRSMAGIFV